MQLGATELIAAHNHDLAAKRQQLKVKPALAIIWVGEDAETASFIRAKQSRAKKLDCAFFSHHFVSSTTDQLLALIQGLNRRRDVHGIVIQLPLPKTIDLESLIAQIGAEKDIDSLKPNSPYPAPAPSGIIDLLTYHNIDPSNMRTAIIGAGRLVGSPLAELFRERCWEFSQITDSAQKKTSFIKEHDLLIAASGVEGLVTPEMVHREMIVIDGSGKDVDVDKIEPLVKAVTPKRGAIGPLTVTWLFRNLFQSLGQ